MCGDGSRLMDEMSGSAMAKGWEKSSAGNVK
jgi:hypothetical protein